MNIIFLQKLMNNSKTLTELNCALLSQKARNHFWHLRQNLKAKMYREREALIDNFFQMYHLNYNLVQLVIVIIKIQVYFALHQIITANKEGEEINTSLHHLHNLLTNYSSSNFQGSLQDAPLGQGRFYHQICQTYFGNNQLGRIMIKLFN